MIKNRIILKTSASVAVLIVIALLTFIHLARVNGQSIKYDRIYSENKDQDIKELVKRAYVYQNENKDDSALVLYVMATSMYSENLSKSDKERCAGAFCNAGYIYLFKYNNYSKAYSMLLHGLTIAEEINSKQPIPYICLNIADIYNNYGEIDQSISLFNKSYEVSKEIKEWEPLLTSFANLLFAAEIHDRRDSVRNAMQTFGKLEISDSIPMKKFCTELSKAVGFIHSGQSGKAIQTLRMAMPVIDDPRTSERVRMQTQSLIIKILSDEKKYNESLAELYTLREMAQKYRTPDFEADADERIWKLSEKVGEKDSAMKYHILYLQMTDSLFSNQKISELKDMQASYEMGRIEDKMKTMIEENERKTIIVALTSIGLVIMFILLLFIYKNNRRLKESNRMLYLRMQEKLETEGTGRKSREKYKSSSLSEDEKGKLVDRINKVMEDIDVISDTNFSIVRLASLIGSNDKYVSQVINETYGKSFSALLAECRVKEACHRLIDYDNYGKLTIEGIALSLGFKSRTNFSAVFKKVTGLTPSQYQEIDLNEKSGKE